MAKGDASGGGIGGGNTASGPQAPKMDQYSVMHMIGNLLGQSGMSPSMNFNPGQPQNSNPFQMGGARQPGPRMGFGGETGAPQQFNAPQSQGFNTFGPMAGGTNQIGQLASNAGMNQMGQMAPQSNQPMGPSPDMLNKLGGM